MASDVSDAALPPVDPKELRRVLMSCFIGSAIEYYDSLLYVTAAALIFGKIFFSDLPASMSTMASLGTLAVSYLSRPVGAVLSGHFGDRYGRKKVLIATLLIMGLATTAIGLLPTMAQIGLWAPALLLLLRLIQGFSVGGEWGGAALMAWEHAPKNRRAFAASFSAAGGPAGTMMAAVMLGICAQLPTEMFESWGWRIPFLISFLLISFGLWMRLSVEESPLFLREMARVASAPTPPPPPILEILAAPKFLFICTLAILPNFVLSALAGSVGLNYAISRGFTMSQILSIQAVSAFFCCLCALVSGHLTDRFGFRRVVGIAMAFGALFVYPFMLMISTGGLVAAFIGYVVMYAFVLAPLSGPMPAYLAEQFSTGARFTGSSLGYQLSSTIGSGLGPVTLFALLHAAGGGFEYVVICTTCIMIVSFICFLQTTRRNEPAGAVRVLDSVDPVLAGVAAKGLS